VHAKTLHDRAFDAGLVRLSGDFRYGSITAHGLASRFKWCGLAVSGKPEPFPYSRQYRGAAALAEGNCDDYQTEGPLLSSTRPASIPTAYDETGGTALREKRTRPFTI